MPRKNSVVVRNAARNAATHPAKWQAINDNADGRSRQVLFIGVRRRSLLAQISLKLFTTCYIFRRDLSVLLHVAMTFV